MGRHRQQGAPFRPTGRDVTGPGGARRRRRTGRTMALLAVSVAVTGGALIVGTGVLPLDGPAAADTPHAKPTTPVAQTPAPVQTPSAQPSAPANARQQPAADPAALPADSGSGKRIVFSERGQRVWLVDADEDVLSTYLVSGSLEDHIPPGSYEIYSRSRWAVGIEDSGTMEYFARFTKGDEGAAIGFHTIPVKDGEPLQTEAQLGTPRSHGCIRQAREDAIRLWEFAPEGTTVVVV